MNWLKALVDFWDGHGTKILGSLAFFVSTALLVPDLIAEGHMKYWLFANALLGGGVVKRGFTNSKNTPPSEQGGFIRISILIFLTMFLSMILFGCTANPVKEAESFEQKSFALYGSYVIFQSKAAELSQDSATPANVRDALKSADAVAYPVAEALVDAAIEVGAIRDTLNACPTLPEPDPACVPTNELRLANAVTNLSSIYFSAQPKLLALVAAVKEAK